MVLSRQCALESEPDGQLILKRQIPGSSLGNSGSVGFVVGPQNPHFKAVSGVNSDADDARPCFGKDRLPSP